MRVISVVAARSSVGLLSARGTRRLTKMHNTNAAMARQNLGKFLHGPTYRALGAKERFALSCPSLQCRTELRNCVNAVVRRVNSAWHVGQLLTCSSTSERPSPRSHSETCCEVKCWLVVI